MGSISVMQIQFLYCREAVSVLQTQFLYCVSNLVLTKMVGRKFAIEQKFADG